MTDKRDWTADIIKICAVITAMPRWVGALLAAEGLIVPADWQSWWIVVSAIFSAGMALVEGLAFAYVFNAWRVQKDKAADKLLWLAVLSGVVFVVVLAPFIAAQVRAVTLANMLAADWALWAWSVGVAASTIVIVASVGYAQKRREVSAAIPRQPAQPVAIAAPAAPKEEKQPVPPKAKMTLDKFLATVGEQAKGEFSPADACKWTELGRTAVHGYLGKAEKAGKVEKVGQGSYLYRNGVEG